MSDSSDCIGEDLENFKGIYYDNDTEKYTCPRTGAHFNYHKLCNILSPIRRSRGDPKVDQLAKPVVQQEGEITFDRSMHLSENFGDDIDEAVSFNLTEELNQLQHHRHALPLEKSPIRKQ